MKEINYCLPIIKASKQEVLTVIQMQQNSYQYFEVWIDYIEDFDEKFLQKLITDLQAKLIIVLRRKNLESIHMSLQKRHAVINMLNNTKAMIDFDVSTQKEELMYRKEQSININTIISYHNYDATPANTQLEKIVHEITANNPTIVKISTLCKNEKDALRLLELQLHMQDLKKRYIILGMGEYGTITRIYGTLWGNEMIFAPVTKTEASAPGQLTKLELEKIFDILSN